VSAGEVHVGDVGTVFRLTLSDGSTIVDASGATTKEILFRKPSGAVVTKSAAFTTDGTDGKIEYVTAAEPVRTMALRYSAAVAGVVLCVAYAVDMLALAGLESGWPLVGCVLTGLLIGRGANFVNDFVERWVRPMAG
jgi:hypothetical protein